jgi:hypothetical protein
MAPATAERLKAALSDPAVADRYRQKITTVAGYDCAFWTGTPRRLTRPVCVRDGAPVSAPKRLGLGLGLDLTDLTDAQAVAAVGRITRGNFRLIHRLFAQIQRVMRINDLTVITNDVIETARSTLVIGDT